jgi:hypothetical protein
MIPLAPARARLSVSQPSGNGIERTMIHFIHSQNRSSPHASDPARGPGCEATCRRRTSTVQRLLEPCEPIRVVGKMWMVCGVDESSLIVIRLAPRIILSNKPRMRSPGIIPCSVKIMVPGELDRTCRECKRKKAQKRILRSSSLAKKGSREIKSRPRLRDKCAMKAGGDGNQAITRGLRKKHPAKTKSWPRSSGNSPAGQ